MTPTLFRYARFNLVGALGMLVQLTSLAAFNRLLHGHYLLASAAALELTLLHNFTGHLLYTWRDRRPTNPLPHLARFHLANGLISLLGNLTLTRILVHHAHAPLLLANLAAILTCSLLNFWIGNKWAFANRPHTSSSRPERPT